MAFKPFLTTAFLTLALAAPIALPAGPAQAQSYAIQPGDTLNIEVLEDPSLNRSVLVAPDGRITVPMAGTVRASGRSVEQIRAALTQQMAPNFAAEPNVTVSLGQLAPPNQTLTTLISVYGLGELNKPGKVQVEPGTTLLQALAEMGGFSQFAATKRIQLRRIDKGGVERVFTVNYKDLQSGRSRMGLTQLQPGDVILVPQRGLFE